MEPKQEIQGRGQSKGRRGVSRVLRAGRESRRSLLGVSLTGMIDVVFNLLVFFVVITTAAQKEGYLPSELPVDAGERGKMEVPALAIEISVYAGESFEECQVELRGVRETIGNFGRLGDILAERHVSGGGLYEADNPVVLRLGEGVSVDQMVKTYNTVVLAGFSNIQFARSR